MEPRPVGGIEVIEANYLNATPWHHPIASHQLLLTACWRSVNTQWQGPQHEHALMTPTHSYMLPALAALPHGHVMDAATCSAMRTVAVSTASAPTWSET